MSDKLEARTHTDAFDLAEKALGDARWHWRERQPLTDAAYSRIVAAIGALRAELVCRTPTPEEVERLRAAIEMALKCTPANSNFYDCGDPFEILREAYEASTPLAQPTADAVGRAREALSEAVEVLERLPYGDWPGKNYSGKSVAANALIRRARKAIAALSTMAGDYVMVPREPTPEMLASTVDDKGTPRILDFTAPDERNKPFLMARYIWRAMIAASPTGGE